MAKNMYQKRAERKEKSREIDPTKTNINWYIPTYGKTHANLHK